MAVGFALMEKSESVWFALHLLHTRCDEFYVKVMYGYVHL